MNFFELIILILNITYIENRMIPLNFATMMVPRSEQGTLSTISEKDSFEDLRPRQELLGLQKKIEFDSEEYFDYDKKDLGERNKKNCAIVVLSSIPNASMQSLLRKYRYDANGILIPNSVKYFVKLPQDLENMSPVLVPLNNKAFSPLGGFVRYYKEVPPIPHSW